TNWISIRVQDRKIRRVHSRPCSRSPARSKEFMIANVERTEQPIKAKLFQIGLGDLDKLCFDLDLLWTGGICLFNQGVNHIEVVSRVVHDQRSVMWKEGRARVRGKTDTHALQVDLGISTTNELTIIN